MVCGEAVLLDVCFSGSRCVDISGNFTAVLRLCGFVMLFCAVFIYRYFCAVAVFLCYSVRCLYRYFCAVLRCSYTPYTPSNHDNFW